MRSAYVNPAPHAEARNAFAFGLSTQQGQEGSWDIPSPVATGPGRRRSSSAKSDVQVMLEKPAPSGGCYPPPKCPGSPRCLTSFPKDWLWTAAPATQEPGQSSWPGGSKGGQSIRLSGDLFGA